MEVRQRGLEVGERGVEVGEHLETPAETVFFRFLIKEGLKPCFFS